MRIRRLRPIVLACALAVAPAVAELCDGRDDDGDGTVDAGCPSSCADPRSLAAEIPLGDQAGRAALGRDRSIVWDGHGFGVAWSEPVGEDTRIAFRRTDPSGAPLGPPVPISATAFSEVDPALDWAGDGYGIVWSEEDFALPRLFFAFVDAAGVRVVGPTPITAAQEAARPAIAWDGEAFVVAWAWYNGRVRVRRVSTDGTLLGVETCVSCDAPSGADETSIAPAPASGSASAAASAAASAPTSTPASTPTSTPAPAAASAAASTAASTPAPAPASAAASAGASATPSAAASTPAPTPAPAPAPAPASASAQIGIAWSDGKGTVHFRRTDHSGQPLGTPLVLHSGHAAQQPAAIWAGDAWTIAWYDRRSGAEGLYLARVSADGVPLGPDQRIDGASEPYAAQPSLAWTGTELLAGWVGGASSAYGLRLRRLDAAGMPLAPPVPFGVTGIGFPDFRAGLVWTGSRPAFVRDQPQPLGAGPVRLRTIECCADADGDGVDACSGDADDGDPRSFPGAAERCNGRDDDQDGTLDEGCDRACDAAPLAGVETRGLQEAPAVGLAAGGDPTRARLARADDGPSGVRLVLDAGGPPWATSLIEDDPATSGEPAVAWTGTGSATLFRDDRTATPALRFSAHAEDGTPIVTDAALGVPSPGTSGPALAWGGRRLAAGFIAGVPPAPRYTLLTGTGARLLDDIALAAAGGAPSVAVAADDGGGSVLAWIDATGAVRLERRDEHGGARGAAIEVAAGFTGRRDIAVVATGNAYTLAWIDAGVVRAVVRRDGTFALPPTPLAGSTGAACRTGSTGTTPTADTTADADATADARDLALAFTGEEVVLVHAGVADGGRLWRTRLDVNGTRLGPTMPLGDDSDIRGVRAVWDGAGVRLAWTAGQGTLAAVRTARLDCAAAPVADRVHGVRFAGRDTLVWDPVEAALYDVVTGDLARLPQGFTAAVDACEASRIATASIDVAPRSPPRFWLVRAVVGTAIGTYDEPPAGGQAAPRDAAIGAATAACP